MKTLIGLIAVSALLATGPAAAFEDGVLRVWINGDKGYDGLQEVGNLFEEELGIPVIVEHPDDATNKFQQSASAGEGPDIFFWPHDRLGEWAGAGLLSPIEPSPEVTADVIDLAWDAFTFNGQLWGYPISVEAISLIYNKDLVPEPPATFEEVIALDAELQEKGARAILWDYTNTYFTWPILAANGGFVFEKTADGFNTDVTGVNSTGAKTGGALIRQMIADGVMAEAATYSVMEAGVSSGEIAMMINGPWAWQNLRDNGINFGVAPIPAVAGQPSRPFVGVLGGMINAASPNKDLAVEFLENYVLTLDGLRAIDADVPLGAPASAAFFEELKGDSNIAGTLASAEAGEPMPNIPEMGRFWSAMEVALENLTSGRQSPEDALDAAADRILRGGS